MKWIAFIGILVVSLSACGSREPLMNIQLPTLQGNSLKMDTIRNYEATIVYFLSPECPLCQNYSLSMREMHQEYKNQDVLFLGIFPGKWYTKNEIRAYTNKYDLQFTMLMDEENRLVNSLEATVTPEVYLINNKGDIEYQGRIDDWVGTLGTKKKKANIDYLKNAVIAFLDDKTIDPDKTEAVGCLIE